MCLGFVFFKNKAAALLIRLRRIEIQVTVHVLLHKFKNSLMLNIKTKLLLSFGVPHAKCRSSTSSLLKVKTCLAKELYFQKLVNSLLAYVGPMPCTS